MQGVDENLNHRVIEDGVRGFVYGSGSIASEYPETFEQSVPKETLALVGAAVIFRFYFLWILPIHLSRLIAASKK